jgi:20S proteasome subunit beta 2
MCYFHRSGSNVDVVVITNEGVDYKRNIRSYNAKSYQKQVPYDFPINNTRTS